MWYIPVGIINYYAQQSNKGEKVIELGDMVKDPVTGIEGIAYARTTYLQGCDRIGVQQKAFKDKEGNTVVPDMWNVDEPQLIILKLGVIKKPTEAKKTGGPSSFSTRK